MIKNIKVGQVIKAMEGETKNRESKTYMVTKIYSNHVLATRYVPETGEVIKRCFNLGDLVMMGLIKQSEQIESKRIYEVVE